MFRQQIAEPKGKVIQLEEGSQSSPNFNKDVEKKIVPKEVFSPLEHLGEH